MRKTTSLIIAVCALATFASAAPASPRYRIVGGAGTSIEAVPYAAALVEHGASAQGSQFCGASIIGPAAVLTAAHCVQGTSAREVDVVSGRTRMSDSDGGQRTPVSRIVVHPGWSPRSGAADAAVLLLGRRVSAAPVAVASSGESALAAAGRPALVAGWGLTSSGGNATSDGLRAVAVTVQSNAVCSRAYGDDFPASTLLCAGGPAGDSCQGDSGGPLVAATDSGAWRQVGIVSFGGERCDDPSTPGAYTRVSSLSAWIMRTAGLAAAPAPAPAPPVTRFGRISCGAVHCRVELRVARDGALGSIVLRVERGALRRSVVAHRLAPGRWAANVDLPFGVVRLAAAALTPDGRRSGSVARITVEVT